MSHPAHRSAEGVPHLAGHRQRILSRQFARTYRLRRRIPASVGGIGSNSATLSQLVTRMEGRFIQMSRCVLTVVVLVAVAGPAVAGLQFQFDYRYDQHGFFDDPVRREALEAAGRVVNRYTDDLLAIIPEGDNGWDAYVTRPDGGGSLILSDVPIPEDTLLIFPGGQPLSGRLAEANKLGPLGRGDPEWQEIVSHRGQEGSAANPPTDIGVKGGTISFNSDSTEVDWHYGLSVAGMESGQFDFITVAAHELFHVLGFGLSPSFNTHIDSESHFIGAESMSEGSTTNPTLKLDEFEAHWERGTKSPWNGESQEALLAPAIYPGRRALPTLLDREATSPHRLGRCHTRRCQS